jgi:hypothetical protein
MTNGGGPSHGSDNLRRIMGKKAKVKKQKISTKRKRWVSAAVAGQKGE